MRIMLAAALAFGAAAPAAAATYAIDATHSTVGFRVRHFVAKTSGRFTQFGGTIEYAEGKPASWKVEATIDPASINTDNEKRDGHLKSPDFFDVEKCPAMGFKSTKVTDFKDGAGKLHGDLTMHCVTKPVVLDLEVGGVQGAKAGFSAKGKIARKDFGIVWNRALDNGGAVLGEEVEVTLDIEADEVKAPAKK
ncbi:MAG: YceI family protein [Elusimicrobiota bacterium]|nr:YceI family protein [Elusimicrobiota bacterium]